MSSCEHEQFEAKVSVARITETEGGPVVAYSADVTIKCARCQEAFVFIGLPGGLSPTFPTCSVLGEEARMPLRPSSEIDQPMPPRKGATGFRVKGGSLRQ